MIYHIFTQSSQTKPVKSSQTKSDQSNQTSDQNIQTQPFKLNKSNQIRPVSASKSSQIKTVKSDQWLLPTNGIDGLISNQPVDVKQR